MVETAIKIAKKAFEDKKDKAGKPYFNHLIRVDYAITDTLQFIDDEVRCIAILHDLLEDCPEWNEDELSCLFNQRVIDGIVAMTHKKGQSYEDYISQVISNKDATLVKKYDLLDNMNITRLSELTEKDFQRLQKYHSSYMRIIDALNGH